jgi:hypothetical protein
VNCMTDGEGLSFDYRFVISGSHKKFSNKAYCRLTQTTLNKDESEIGSILPSFCFLFYLIY